MTATARSRPPGGRSRSMPGACSPRRHCAPSSTGSARCCSAPRWMPGDSTPSRPGSCWRRWWPAPSWRRWRWAGGVTGGGVAAATSGSTCSWPSQGWCSPCRRSRCCWPVWRCSGALSTEVVESGPFTTLEQSMLATDLPPGMRVRGFSRYNAVAAAAGSAGALLAAGPSAARRLWSGVPADQRFFVVFVPVALAGAWIARRLSPAVEADHRERARTARAGAITVGRAAPGRPVRPRLVRRRVRRPGVHRLLALPSLRRHHHPNRRGVRRRRGVADGVVPGCRSPGRALRSAPHDGVHPPAVEPAPRRRGVRAEPDGRSRVAARPHSAVPDGRPHPSDLRHGPRRSGRAHCGGSHHQHRPLRRSTDRPDPRRRRCFAWTRCSFVIAGGLKSVYDVLLWRWFRHVPLPDGPER